MCLLCLTVTATSILDRLILAFDRIIVNRGKWLGSPAHIKEANKEAKI